MDQSRWNEDYGSSALAMFQADPDAFLVDPINWAFTASSSNDSLPTGAMQVLDFGCGQGELSIAMALRDATVTGIDIGADLIGCRSLWGSETLFSLVRRPFRLR